MPRPTLRTSNTLDGGTTTIPFSTAALKANLLRLENEWEAYQVTRERDAVYVYLERIPVTWKRSLHVGSNWRTLAD